MIVKERFLIFTFGIYTGNILR